MTLPRKPPLASRAEADKAAGVPLGPRLYGILAEFGSPEEITRAARAAREAGYRRIDAYTPFPIPELGEIIAVGRSKVPWIILVGGIAGGVTGFLLQYYSAAIRYPLNIGGRPLDSWPMFIPITFELTILAGGLSALLGMFVLNNLPMPYHPVFNVPSFAMATRDRYFLSIQAVDPKFDREATRAFLLGLSPHEVIDVLP